MNSFSLKICFSTVSHRCSLGSGRHRKLARTLRSLGDELYLCHIPITFLAVILFARFLPRCLRQRLWPWGTRVSPNRC
ncbi:hypothetical protein BsWGS_07561 [Bradybaena similaris]